MINIKDLYRNYKDYADKEVTIGGWLRSKRDSKTCLLYTYDTADEL